MESNSTYANMYINQNQVVPEEESVYTEEIVKS